MPGCKIEEEWGELNVELSGKHTCMCGQAQSGEDMWLTSTNNSYDEAVGWFAVMQSNKTCVI